MEPHYNQQLGQPKHPPSQQQRDSPSNRFSPYSFERSNMAMLKQLHHLIPWELSKDSGVE